MCVCYGVEACWRVGVSASVSAWSPAGGVVQQYPKPTRLNGRKKMLIALSQGRAIFVKMEYKMDHLLQCAKSFGRLS